MRFSARYEISMGVTAFLIACSGSSEKESSIPLSLRAIHRPFGGFAGRPRQP